MSWIYFQDAWSLNHKCTFDGINKLIIVGPNTSTISVKQDIYSDWKEWVALYDNAKFEPALRTTGGDPIGGGQFTGDVYFTINNWRIQVDHSCMIDGVIYSDNFPSPFVPIAGTQIVTNKVSSLVNTVSVGGGGSGGGASAAEIWNYGTRTLTSGAPTAAQIRQEMDANSAKLSQIAANQWSATERSQIRNRLGVDGTSIIPTTNPTLSTSVEVAGVLSAVSDISVSTSAINAAAVGFTLNAGLITSGTYLDTATMNGISHVIRDDATAFDVEYLFDIGVSGVPSQFIFIGHVTDQHEIALVHAWNYVSGTWEIIGNISGTKANATSIFSLYPHNTSTTPGLIGDVKIRFTCSTISDIIITIDQMYITYAVVQKESGYTGHAVSATSTTIVLNSDASSVDNYYVPCIVSVDHGTGAQQFAKVIGYTGSTKTLQLELPMAITLDSTSHITLQPWATANMPTTQYNDLTSQIAGLTPAQETMITEMYKLMGLDPTKPLIVTKTTRTAGVGISQTITGDANSTTVTRV